MKLVELICETVGTPKTMKIDGEKSFKSRNFDDFIAEAGIYDTVQYHFENLTGKGLRTI